ncbi:hypothetical protein EI010_25510, partial [Escherichia coli]|nr:hypothetical protein [Escherichia coli]
FKVVGSSATNSNNKYIQTYLDTTTAQIGLPKTYISQVFDSLGISTNVMNAIYPTIVPCNTKITLTFGFVSGTTVSITERDLVISFFGTCRLQIIPTTDRIILGLPLYRGRCTYFDPIMQRVG